MALVVFLRGVNVGGHRTFRPSVLAKDLADFGVVNIGAAGTFVVRNPGSRTAFRAALAAKLPFETHIMLCDAKALLSLHLDNPFGLRPAAAGVVRFVSVLGKASRAVESFPLQLPPRGEWLVRVIGTRHPFAFGEYRRDMKTIGYLGQVDKLFGVPATTRNWNTIDAIAKVLNARTPE
jgi:uncharacterized protein (DUF1697 family)